MPRIKKNQPIENKEETNTPELNLDLDYTTDIEDYTDIKTPKTKTPKKRKYTKRKTTKTTKAPKIPKATKATKSTKGIKPTKATKAIIPYSNINKRLEEISASDEEEEMNMRPMNSPNDLAMIRFIPKTKRNIIKGTKGKKGKKGKRTLKQKITLPKTLLDRIKQSRLNKHHQHITHNHNLGYNSDNEDDLQEEEKIEQHTRRAGVLYTSITKNGKTMDRGTYIINNSSNPYIINGSILNGVKQEKQIPRN